MKFGKGISWKGFGKGILFGVLTGFAVMRMVCGIGALLVSGGRLSEDAMDLLATLALLLGAAVGAIVAMAGKAEGLWIACGMYAMAWFLVLFCVGTILYENALSGVGVTALMCAGCSAGVCLCKMRRSNGRGRLKHRYKVHSFVHNAQ